jgi:hypothetical protein
MRVADILLHTTRPSFPASQIHSPVDLDHEASSGCDHEVGGSLFSVSLPYCCMSG